MDRFGAKIIHRDKIPSEPCKIFLHAKKRFDYSIMGPIQFERV